MVDVTLHRWGSSDMPLLEAANTPEMTRFLGGPETPEQLRDRHARYVRLNERGEAWMFRIAVDGAPAGGIGVWPIERDGTPAHEAGWNVLRSFRVAVSRGRRCDCCCG